MHGSHACVEDHGNDNDFVMMMIDLRNALTPSPPEECRAYYPELFQWAA